MSLFLTIHPQNPQAHLLRKSVAIINEGGVIVYPTDSGYALACQIGNKQALERIRQIRQLDSKHLFTIVCRDLSELSVYAKISNRDYRLLKACTPGPFTFILPATREAPRRLQNAKRKTVGFRIPDHIIALSLLETLDAPLISTTLLLPGEEISILEAEAIRDLLGKRVDLIIDGGNCGLEPTTVVDLSKEEPIILRQGKGNIRPYL